MKIFPLLIFAVLLTTERLIAQPASEPSSRATAGVAKKSEAEDLIDSLLNLGDQTTGADSMAIASQFMALDEEPEFMGGIIGAPKPQTPPAMRRLVQLGLVALPTLLEHLSDERATKLVIKHGGLMGGMWLSDEYDPRYPNDVSRRPAKVNTGGGGSPDMRSFAVDGSFTVHVGDLCYLLIGQIVNRNLTAVRYQPTASVVVNSPVAVSALAAATRQDWEGLTPEAHAASLENDAKDNTVMWPDALKRLCYYYPVRGEQVALTLLNREISLPSTIEQLLLQEVLPSDQPARWTAAYQSAQSKFGQAVAVSMLDLLRSWTAKLPPFQAYEDKAAGSRGVIEGQFFSEWYNPIRMGALTTFTVRKYLLEPGSTRARLVLEVLSKVPPLPGAAPRPVVSMDAQTRAIKALRGFPSAKLDAAVHAVFLDAVQKAKIFEFPGGGYSLDQVAIECARRLAGKGLDPIYRAYLEGRLAELPNKNSNGAKALQQALDLLKGKTDSDGSKK